MTDKKVPAPPDFQTARRQLADSDTLKAAGALSQMNVTGKIYVLFAENTSLHYVGFTMRPVGDRCVEIARCSPLPLRVVSVFFGTKADLAWIHRALGRFRVHHNWFNLPENAVWWLVKKSIQYPETPDKLVELEI